MNLKQLQLPNRKKLGIFKDILLVTVAQAAAKLWVTKL